MTMDSYSRFNKVPLILVGGVESRGRWALPEALRDLSSENIIQVKVDQKNAGRPDLIATEYYGTPYLDWVITLYNKPLNPLGWPLPGSIIQVPTKQVVVRSL